MDKREEVAVQGFSALGIGEAVNWCEAAIRWWVMWWWSVRRGWVRWKKSRGNRRALSVWENAHQDREGRNDLKTYESGPRESIIGIEEMQELQSDRPVYWLVERLASK
jgi:hypothetical protein